MALSAFSDFHTVSIDFDVFKELTARLQSPSDTYNEVLRRLLDLGPTNSQPTAEPSPSDGRAWVAGGVSFPHGTELRSKYKGTTYAARVDNGALVYNGKRYDSPSPAAMAVTGNSVNGWTFWECRIPGRSAWTVIDGLRSK